MKVLNWLLNKKSDIGLILLVVLQGVGLLFPDLIKSDVYVWIERILILLVGGVRAKQEVIKTYPKFKNKLSTLWNKQKNS